MRIDNRFLSPTARASGPASNPTAYDAAATHSGLQVHQQAPPLDHESQPECLLLLRSSHHFFPNALLSPSRFTLQRTTKPSVARM